MKISFFKPNVTNIKSMQELVEEDVINGNILSRDSSEMATTIRSYTTVNIDDKLAGFIALHIHSPSLAEIRSLVVKNKYRKKGIGKNLIRKAINEAKEYKLKEVLVLTYKDKLFRYFGFNLIDKKSIPNTKIWSDCIKCKHFPICDEIALLKTI
jgi:amino-acid N-acetyltransferase